MIIVIQTITTMINKRGHTNKSFFGFDSLQDYGSTIIAFKHFEWVMLGSTIGGLSTFISNYVYPNSQSIWTLIGLVLLDGFSGIWRSIDEKKFSSKRLPRILLTLVSYIGFLSASFFLTKDQSSLEWIPTFILSGLSITTFISIIENLSALGVLPQNIVNRLLSYFKKKESDEEPKQ
jgi:phage-related holin